MRTLLLCAWAVTASAFRVPGVGGSAGARSVYAAAAAASPDASGSARGQLSRRALGPLALGAAVALIAPQKAAAGFPNIASIKQQDIDRWIELDGTRHCIDGDGVGLHPVFLFSMCSHPHVFRWFGAEAG
jgi:hypothetical protein